MILRINYKSGQKGEHRVRMATVYNLPSFTSGPELVIQMEDVMKPQKNIPLEKIQDFYLVEKDS